MKDSATLDRTKEAYVIEELWTDFMENSLSKAMVWKLVGVALTEEAAISAIGSSKHPGAKWPPITPNTPMRRWRKVPIL